jgi:uncharacterized protein (DUF1015 family)
MADFKAFEALRYEPDVAGDPSGLISPPYDVVSPSQAAALYSRSPFNIARVDNGEQRPADNEGENRYSRAAALVNDWRRQGALVRDAAPRMYVYDQEFESHGRRRRRRAIFGRLRLEEWEKGIVLPHEHTGTEAKQDRLNLLRATRVHLSPILALYENGAPALGESALEPPVLDAVLPGERHTLRPLSSSGAAKVSAFLSDKRLYVADGHHRYETGLNYRNEVRGRAAHWTGEEPENFVLSALVDAGDPDLVVLPTHRLLRLAPGSDAIAGLERHFEVEDRGEAADSAAVERLTEALAAAGRSGPAFAAAGLLPGRLHLLRPRSLPAIDGLVPRDHAEPWRRLDVSVLEYVVYPDIGFEPSPAAIDYTEEAAEAVKAVLTGRFDLALLLNPTPVDQVIACSNAGERMPRKSTFFYPKLATGVVMYPLD